MAGTEEYEQLEKNLLGRIGNRKYAYCTVRFKDGSFRCLNLYIEPELTLDLNTDARRLINRFIDQCGKVEEVAFSEQ